MPKLRNVLAASTVLCALSAAAPAQTVTTLVNQAPPDGVVYGFLMTDGSVMFQGGGIYDWYKFTPDAYGSYQNGTWSSVASLPAGYGPYANAGAVLPDGRLLISGGEYLVNKADTKLVFKLSTKSAVYDPRANTWTVFSGPRNWRTIGDSPGTVLANGKFLLGEKVTKRQALLDATTLKWLPVASVGKADHNTEEGWTLMPGGSILTADVLDAPNSERYLPSASGLTGEWMSDGSTVANLKFNWTGPNSRKIAYKHDGQTYYYKPAGEIGPAILRPDGSVFATGALNTKPVKAIAGHTAVYHPGRLATDPGTWLPGPDFQPGDDAGDEYAVLLPNGNVLVEANTNGSDEDNDTRAMRLERLMQTHTPMSASIRLHTAAPALAPARNPCAPFPVQIYHLYEFDGTDFTRQPVDVQTCGNSLNLLGLPTGETIVGGVGLYTSATGNPAPDWAPVVTAHPATIAVGGVYRLSGKRLTGMSQANAFGDELVAPTNYPLVRVTNAATGHVFYCRTHDWTDSGVATGNKIVTTSFDVPGTIEPGPSILEVVANGIASRSVPVTVR